MYCNYCGKELPKKAKFCNHCGKQVNIISAKDSIGAQQPAPAKKKSKAGSFFLALLIIMVIYFAMYYISANVLP